MDFNFVTRRRIAGRIDYSLAMKVLSTLGVDREFGWEKLINEMKESLDYAVFEFFNFNLEYGECVKLAQEILENEQKDFLNFCKLFSLEAVLLMGELFLFAVSLWLRKHNKGVLGYKKILQIENGRYREATPQELYDWFGHEKKE